MLEEFSNARILVIGDVMLDRYWWGTVNRISPEAPVPVVSLDATTLAAGGAANVAANVAGLGAEPHLVGITGDDAEAELFGQVMAESGIPGSTLFPIPGRRTTLKNRIVAHNQQMIRLDQESSEEIPEAKADGIFAAIRPLIEAHDVVLLSDYAKGFLTAAFVRQVIEFARAGSKKIVVDPKGRDYSKYRRATILTPNQREAADACSLDHDVPNVVDNAGGRLLGDLDLDALLITQGERGMTLFQRDLAPTQIEAHARKVYNVTGAGDTAIATLAVALGSGKSFVDSANLANLAAGLVVEDPGTTAISREMLAAERDRG